MAKAKPKRERVITPCPVNRVLVDRRNLLDLIEPLATKIAKAEVLGFDIETTNRFAHPGILKMEEKKVLFDTNRQVVTGFSLYCDGDDTAYYFNLWHADEENRLDWLTDCKPLMDLRSPNCLTICHNAAFELVMMRKSLGYDLGPNTICSMQLCVTAYGPDEYPLDKFFGPGVGDISSVMPQVARLFANYRYGEQLTEEQEELLFKIIAKESDAKHSYNGYVKSISYGYGLKQAVKSWFGYDMETYDEVLNGKERMDELTGREVAEYGADDAYWCVRLYHRVIQYLMETNPLAIETFFRQENPAVHTVAELNAGGMRIDFDAVEARRAVERQQTAATLRRMKAAIRSLLPFDKEPHDKLMSYDSKWYEKNWGKYRDKWEEWALSPDSAYDFDQCMQIRSPTSAGWAAERGVAESSGPNLTHYMPMRVMLYDLCRFSFQLADGSVQSDGDARAVMLQRYAKKWAEARGKKQEDVFNKDKGAIIDEELKGDPRVVVLDCYKQLAGSEQRMKLYLNPYLLLTDPDNHRIYPSFSSLLATRRFAAQNPNSSQWAKFGESAYIRGFFLADNDDHVLVSADWSAVELVIIANYSQDPAFLEAYGTRPHRDIHSWAASQMLRVSLEEFSKHPEKKRLRTDYGKSANFGWKNAPCSREAA